MTWRLLIDQNLPASLAEKLATEVADITSLGKQPSDDELWSHARKEALVVVTKDADFFNKLALHGLPPKVVWIRTGNMRRADLESLLTGHWPRIQQLLPEADLIEVHRDRLEAIKF